MAESAERLKYLFEQYAANQSTEDEVKEFFGILKTSANDESVRSMLMQLVENTEVSPTYDTDRWDKVLQKVLRPDGAEVIKMYPNKFVTLRRVAAAAVILLLLSVGGYLYFNGSKEKQVAKTVPMAIGIKNDVAPGGNKAILTLANGKQIILDSAANGTLTQQGNTKIIKLDDGQLSYASTLVSTAGANMEVLYNTISTPKGGQYQILLADGSKVWLNAASSLRFPASFTGKERNVELTGEGYFEVAKNAAMPFHVKVNDVIVQVLGTHFNINAYDDEATIKTTLLEGSVTVAKGSSSKVIKPGEQAQISYSPSTGGVGGILVQTVDLEETMAWKNGLFQFDRSDIKSIMRQVARWYDVEVVYETDIDEKFGGSIPRNVNASKLFQMLELTNHVHFKIEGKKVTVMP